MRRETGRSSCLWNLWESASVRRKRILPVTLRGFVLLLLCVTKRHIVSTFRTCCAGLIASADGVDSRAASLTETLLHEAVVSSSPSGCATISSSCHHVYKAAPPKQPTRQPTNLIGSFPNDQIGKVYVATLSGWRVSDSSHLQCFRTPFEIWFWLMDRLQWFWSQMPPTLRDNWPEGCLHPGAFVGVHYCHARRDHGALSAHAPRFVYEPRLPKEDYRTSSYGRTKGYPSISGCINLSETAFPSWVIAIH